MITLKKKITLKWDEFQNLKTWFISLTKTIIRKLGDFKNAVSVTPNVDTLMIFKVN